MILEVQGLRVATGPMIRLHGLDLRLESGGCIALLGPNGAGKTACVEAIAGLLPKAAGHVLFDAKDISSLSASEIARRGLTLVPQWRELFPGFTVEETLYAGANAARGRSPIPIERIYEIFPRLAERRQQLAGSLSGGEQQMLAIGRALMGNPRVLLMDEPSEGLAPQLVAEVGRTIAQLKAEGQSIVLVEQNIKLTLDLADDIVIINTGRVVFHGTADQIKLDDAIVSQHLGVF
jgi:branched-chain amino acid transport system ATP-binding protein